MRVAREAGKRLMVWPQGESILHWANFPMRSRLNTFGERELTVVADVAQQIFEASLVNGEVLKASIQAADEKEHTRRWFTVVCEFLYFFMHITNRLAYRELGHERRCEVQRELYPLIARPTIEAICGHWPHKLKDGMENDFGEKLNDAEVQYGACRKFVDPDNPFAEDALLSKFANIVCELLGVHKSDFDSYEKTHGTITALTMGSLEQMNLPETIRAVGTEHASAQTAIPDELSHHKTKRSLGWLGRLFGPSPKAYVDAGVRLTHELILSLTLGGWKDLVPEYTPEEIEAIDQELSNFQRTANSMAAEEEGPGARMLFHPEAAPEIRRTLIGQALEGLAARDRRFLNEDRPQADWRQCVSAYLKAWSSNLSATVLLEIGDLLFRVGRKQEARKAFEVVLLYPSYIENRDQASKESIDNAYMTAKRAAEHLQRLGA